MPLAVWSRRTVATYLPLAVQTYRFIINA